MIDVVVSKEAFGDFLVKRVMTADEEKTIYETLEYAFQLHVLGRQLLMVSVLDNEEYKKACECFGGTPFEGILENIVCLVRSSEGGPEFSKLYKHMTGEDDPAVKATKESVIAWMESFAAILSSEYFVEDETVDTFLSQIGVVKHFLR